MIPLIRSLIPTPAGMNRMPMLPFLAQGAAMAIEDAAVLAIHMAQTPDDPAHAIPEVDAARLRRLGLTERDALQRILRQRALAVR